MRVRAAQEQLSGLIFTFAPERTVRPEFIATIVTAVENVGANVLFVRLTCPEEEIERRMENDSRAEFGKLRSLELYQRLQGEGAFAFPALPDSGLTIDTSKSDPSESAHRIFEYFRLPSAN